jgi:hypothetical protein
MFTCEIIQGKEEILPFRNRARSKPKTSAQQPENKKSIPNGRMSR